MATVIDADMSGADLRGVDVASTFLTGVNLTGADLNGAQANEVQLIDANLTNANLSGASLLQAGMVHTNLSGADLRFGVVGLDTSFGIPFYSLTTDFSATDFDPVAAGWTLIPEPTTASLLALGLLGLAMRRRR